MAGPETGAGGPQPEDQLGSEQFEQPFLTGPETEEPVSGYLQENTEPLPMVGTTPYYDLVGNLLRSTANTQVRGSQDNPTEDETDDGDDALETDYNQYISTLPSHGNQSTTYGSPIVISSPAGFRPEVGILVPYDFERKRVKLELLPPGSALYRAFAIEEEDSPAPPIQVGDVYQFSNNNDPSSDGGLTRIALQIHNDFPGGWAGTQTKEDRILRETKTAEDGTKVGTLNFYVKPAVYKAFYRYISQTVWMAAHDLPTNANFKDEDGYQATMVVNKLAGKLCDETPEDSILIFHDNHFAYAGAFTERDTGLFIHSPFADLATFKKFPHAKEMIGAMLQNRFIGFQDEASRMFFIEAVEKYFGKDEGLIIDHDKGSVLVTTDSSKRGLPTYLDVAPVGISPVVHREQARTEEVLAASNELRQLYPDKFYAATWGRGDPAKAQSDVIKGVGVGIPIYDAIRDRLVYEVDMPETRKGVHKSYPKEQKEARDASQNVNAKVGREVVIFREQSIKGIAKSKLHHMNAGIIGSRREGFGLAGAAEGIMATLNLNFRAITGRRSGLKHLLGESILDLDPRDLDSVAEAFNTAITMSPEEAIERLAIQKAILYANRLERWSREKIVQKMVYIRSQDKLRVAKPYVAYMPEDVFQMK